MPGIVFKELVHGDGISVSSFEYECDTDIPLHAHIYEQIYYVLSGRLNVWVEGSKYTLLENCSLVILANEKHSAQAESGSRILEIFNPIRNEYITNDHE